MINEKHVTLLTRFSAILKQRCPRCLHGKPFAGLWDIKENCPVCGLEFEREPGYFLGAMYFSYGLAIITGLPTFTILFFLGLPNLWILVILGIQLVLTSPLLLRYSRAMWLHMDQMVDPR